MTRKRPSNLRREIRELREEVARLRAELAARVPVAPMPTLPASQPWQPYPGVQLGDCGACRLSGACNCVRYDRTTCCEAPSVTADTTLQIAPGTTRMIPMPNAGACAGWAPVTIYDTTGAAQAFTVQTNSAANFAAGQGLFSVLP